MDFTLPGQISALLQALPEEAITKAAQSSTRYPDTHPGKKGPCEASWAAVERYMSEVVRYETLQACQLGKCDLKETYKEQQSDKPHYTLYCYCYGCDRVGYLMVQPGEEPNE